jgi:hypothetical protein
MSKQRRILFAAVTAAVGVLLVSGCAPEKETPANAVAESMAEVKPVVFTELEETVQKTVCENFAPEKTREDRIALRATAEYATQKKKSAPLPPAKEETAPVQEAQCEIKNISLTPSGQRADTRPARAAWNEESSLSDINIAQEQEKVNTKEAPPTPPAEISYSANGWQPTAAEHDHGAGVDSGVCPACGLLYGPAGGVQGQYTAQDGLMD